MSQPGDQTLLVGLLAIGRERPGFDPDWARHITASAMEACRAAPLEAVQPPEPVVDDATLRRAVAQFRQAGCGTLLVLQPTMGDGRLAPILGQLWNGPLVLWATPERPEAERVTACSLVGTHVFATILRQMHRPFELVYGHPDEDSTRERVVSAVRVTTAAGALRRAKVGLVGYHAPGFVNMHVDPVALSDELGVQLHHIGLAEFQQRVEACRPAAVEHDVEAVRAMQVPMDESLGPDDLTPNSRYYLATRELMAEESLDALAIRCWPELPNLFGHWPYLAMMRLTEDGLSVALEGDVDAAILGLIGRWLGLGAGYVSDWLAHDEDAITLWHPGHAPRDMCAPHSLKLGRHFNNNRPLVVNAQLAAGQPVTLARLWRCDGHYHLTALSGRTAAPKHALLGAHGVVVVEGGHVPDHFDHLCHAGMPHHVTVFTAHQEAVLKRLARAIGVEWTRRERL